MPFRFFSFLLLSSDFPSAPTHWIAFQEPLLSCLLGPLRPHLYPFVQSHFHLFSLTLTFSAKKDADQDYDDCSDQSPSYSRFTPFLLLFSLLTLPFYLETPSPNSLFCPLLILFEHFLLLAFPPSFLFLFCIKKLAVFLSGPSWSSSPPSLRSTMGSQPLQFIGRV